MTAQELTAFVILAVAFGLGIYDFVIAHFAGGGATISWVIYEWSRKYPAIAFGGGFLCGHLFAQMLGTKP